jgi:hypothetical protein
MKKFIFGFKKMIRFTVSIFASREFAFIYCLAGTLTQVTHTYFLTEAISSFSGGFKHFQATLISFFISSSLLYFVAIADNSDTKENRRNHLAVNIFMFIEILINFYYYSRHLIIDAVQWQVFDFIFAVLVSCLIPVTIKLYANTIRAKDWIEDMELSKVATNSKVDVNIDTQLAEMIDNRFAEIRFDLETNLQTELNKSYDKNTLENSINEIIKDKFFESIDEEVSKIFDKHQNLFLQQFENKCKVFIKNQLKSENIESAINEITTNQ